MSRALLFFVAILFLFCGAIAFWFASNGQVTGGSVSEVDTDYVAPIKELTEFEFIDQYAKPFNSKELEGRVWMASFFFASCPSICRQQNADIAKIHQRFKDQDVTILNITVTPDEDSPHVLLLYANQFDADHDKWKFLTGKSLDYVKQVGAEFFNLPAADESHTTDVALFDRSGQMHGPYKVTDPQERTKLVVKVEEFLADDASTSTTTWKETSGDSAEESSQEPVGAGSLEES